jgi:phage-related tail fiber protein
MDKPQFAVAEPQRNPNRDGAVPGLVAAATVYRQKLAMAVAQSLWEISQGNPAWAWACRLSTELSLPIGARLKSTTAQARESILLLRCRYKTDPLV